MNRPDGNRGANGKEIYTRQREGNRGRMGGTSRKK